MALDVKWMMLRDITYSTCTMLKCIYLNKQTNNNSKERKLGKRRKKHERTMPSPSTTIKGPPFFQRYRSYFQISFILDKQQFHNGHKRISIHSHFILLRVTEKWSLKFSFSSVVIVVVVVVDVNAIFKKLRLRFILLTKRR